MSAAKQTALDNLRRQAVLFMRRMGHSKDTSSKEFIEACRIAETFGVTDEQICDIIDEAAEAAK